MITRYLLDTSICIYLRQKRPPEVIAKFRRLETGEAALSVITYGELAYGAERSRQRAAALETLIQLVSLLTVLPLPEAAGSVYGEIRAMLATRGEMIGNNDLWIAAHAKAAGMTLVTNNEREFRRVAGLRIQNWTSRSK